MAQAGRSCIGSGTSEGSAAGCLLTSIVTYIDRGVGATIIDAAAGRWSRGNQPLGLAERAVGLAPFQRPLPDDVRGRLQQITDQLAAGELTTGA